MSTVSSKAGGVLLEGPGREADVADLRGQHAAEVLPDEQPLDLALRVLGDVDAVVVEEPHHDRLRIAGDEADGEAARGHRLAGEEAGDRHRRHLEVEDVDARPR